MKKIIKIVIVIPMLLFYTTQLQSMQPKKLETQIEKALREENITEAENLIAKLQKFKGYKHLANEYEIQLLERKLEKTKAQLEICKTERTNMETKYKAAGRQLTKCKDEKNQLKRESQRANAQLAFYRSKKEMAKIQENLEKAKEIDKEIEREAEILRKYCVCPGRKKQ